MNSINISVIIPIYNGEKFLEKCVRSLFEQTITDIEFIFVDDCTRDKSITLIETLIKEYPERKPFLKIIHHEQNKGVAAARNTGIDNASGEYLFFIDQDDYLDNDALEIFYNNAKAENADIVYSNYLFQYKHHCKIRKNKEMIDKQSYLVEMLRGKVSWELWARLYKKELFDKYTLRLVETAFGVDDVAIVPVLYYYANRTKYVNFASYHYVQYNSQAVTKQTLNKDRVEAIVCALDYLRDFFKDKDDVYGNAVEWLTAVSKVSCLQRTSGELQQYTRSLFPKTNIKIGEEGWVHHFIGERFCVYYRLRKYVLSLFKKRIR